MVKNTTKQAHDRLCLTGAELYLPAEIQADGAIDVCFDFQAEESSNQAGIPGQETARLSSGLTLNCMTDPTYKLEDLLGLLSDVQSRGRLVFVVWKHTDIRGLETHGLECYLIYPKIDENQICVSSEPFFNETVRQYPEMDDFVPSFLNDLIQHKLPGVTDYCSRFDLYCRSQVTTGEMDETPGLLQDADVIGVDRIVIQAERGATGESYSVYLDHEASVCWEMGDAGFTKWYRAYSNRDVSIIPKDDENWLFESGFFRNADPSDQTEGGFIKISLSESCPSAVHLISMKNVEIQLVDTTESRDYKQILKKTPLALFWDVFILPPFFLLCTLTGYKG